MQSCGSHYPVGMRTTEGVMTKGSIGVDIGGTGTKAAVVSEDGKILARAYKATDVHAGTKSIIDSVEDLLAQAAQLEVEIQAVGVGAAGFINAATGTITFAPNLVYDDPKVAEALRGRTGLAVTVDNDANAAAWGEYEHGAGRGSEYVAYISMGTGVGSGFIIEGRLVRGLTGAGAEMGHTVIDAYGAQCKCGLRGCLEQYASGQAITRMAKEAVANDPGSSILAFAGSVDAIGGEHVAKAARQYDAAARAVLRRSGRALGIGLSNVANIFDPEVIVLGGGVVAAGEAFLGPARDELAHMTEQQRRRPIRLAVSELKDDAGIIGAAALGRHEATSPITTRADRGPGSP